MKDAIKQMVGKLGADDLVHAIGHDDLVVYKFSSNDALLAFLSNILKLEDEMATLKDPPKAMPVHGKVWLVLLKAEHATLALEEHLKGNLDALLHFAMDFVDDKSGKHYRFTVHLGDDFVLKSAEDFNTFQSHVEDVVQQKMVGGSGNKKW